MSSIDMERFREDINRYRFETDTTWTALAEKAGVSPAMFTRLKKGSVVTLEAFAQLCASCASPFRHAVRCLPAVASRRGYS